MKIVVSLLVVQTLLSLFLLIKTTLLSQSLDRLALQAPEAPMVSAKQHNIESSQPQTAENELQSAYPLQLLSDSAQSQIRKILREELQTITAASAISTTPKELTANLSKEEKQAALEQANMAVEQILADGRFSPEEMGELEQSLAKLSKAERQKIFQRLAREVNRSAL